MSEIVEERRAARVGTVSGLALLAGSTAVAAVAGGAHSIFATIMLGLLAAGMGHALLDEIRRQARRRSAPGWARHDTVNTVLLASWAAGALIAAASVVTPTAVRAVGLGLSLAYALCCACFVVERRRTITIMGGAASPSPPTDSPRSWGPSTAPPPSTEAATGVIPDGYDLPHR